MQRITGQAQHNAKKGDWPIKLSLWWPFEQHNKVPLWPLPGSSYLHVAALHGQLEDEGQP